MWFTRISIGNPVLATMMMAAFVVLGLFSYQRLSVDQFPDVNFPVVVVQTEYPGRLAGKRRDRRDPQDRGSGQHHQRHQERCPRAPTKALSVVIVEFDLTRRSGARGAGRARKGGV